jgi:hypothetical protein
VLSGTRPRAGFWLGAEPSPMWQALRSLWGSAVVRCDTVANTAYRSWPAKRSSSIIPGAATGRAPQPDGDVHDLRCAPAIARRRTCFESLFQRIGATRAALA